MTSFSKQNRPRSWHIVLLHSAILMMVLPVQSAACYAEQPFSPTVSTVKHPLRNWTDATGRFNVQAAFIGKTKENVFLVKSSQKRIEVKFDSLSSHDQAYIKGLLTQQNTAAQDQSSKRDLKSDSNRFLSSLDTLNQNSSYDFWQTTANSKTNWEVLNVNLPPSLPSNFDRQDLDLQFASIGPFVVRKSDVVSAIITLAEIDQKLSGASGWAEWKMRDERSIMAQAKTEAQRRNRAELQRVFRERQIAVYQRQHAFSQIRALMNRRAFVAAVDPVSGRTRKATARESSYYANSLYQFANSRFEVSRPQKTITKELYDFDEINRLETRCKYNDKLARFVKQQLRGLSSEHSKQVEQLLLSLDKQNIILAIRSLGWWNGSLGQNLVLRYLKHADPELRNAALSALPQVIKSCQAAKRFARSEDSAVRVVVAEELVFLMSDLKQTLRITATLLADNDSKVRKSAYASFDKIAELRQATRLQETQAVISAFHKRSAAEPTIAAIDWIDRNWIASYEQEIEIKNNLVSVFLKHSDATVREFAKSRIVDPSSEVRRGINSSYAKK